MQCVLLFRNLRSIRSFQISLNLFCKKHCLNIRCWYSDAYRFLPQGVISYVKLTVSGNDISVNETFILEFEYINPNHWTISFKYALDQLDPRDYLERLEQEKQLLSQFETLNEQAITINAAAQALLDSIPEPPSAILRKGSLCWKAPSTELMERFPLLFCWKVNNKSFDWSKK